MTIKCINDILTILLGIPIFMYLHKIVNDLKCFKFPFKDNMTFTIKNRRIYTKN